jgi:hypothetical protein
MARTAIYLECSSSQPPDAAEVDRMARLHLALRRQGLELRLRNPSSPLLELIDFCGLGCVLGVEAGGEAEEWEQPLRVEEERQFGDPPG